MKIMNTKLAPTAIGPYSQGIMIADFIVTSGQIPVDPLTNQIVEGIENQAEQCCQNIEGLLKSYGSDMSQVIKTTCYLKNMNDFEIFNKIYEKYFISQPARSLVAVKELPKNVLCEIEAIAYKEE